MTFFRVARRVAVPFLFCLALSGCFPPGNSQSDEQKEPHFLRGKSLAVQMDSKGAVDAFEEALKINPDSASAHYELAVLYESRDAVADPAAAIYHYQRFLRLRPKANNADVVNTHIGSCKLELARTVSALPLTPSMQRDFDKLLAENRELKTRISQWEAAYNSLKATPVSVSNPVAPIVTNRIVPPRAQQIPVHSGVAVGPGLVQTSHLAGAAVAMTNPVTPTNRAPTGPVNRTHTVKSGELPFTIARHYGISVESLLAANPQINARRMKVGQTLIIPGS